EQPAYLPELLRRVGENRTESCSSPPRARLGSDELLGPHGCCSIRRPWQKASAMSHYELGTDAPWYRGRELTEQQRAAFRARSQRSHRAKLHALAGKAVPIHPVNEPAFDPGALMPVVDSHGLAGLSLFSGGGGLDLGFDRAGYSHLASYDTLEAAGQTLASNRPDW